MSQKGSMYIKTVTRSMKTIYDLKIQPFESGWKQKQLG